MRIRGHKYWLIGLTLGGCVLNPQPDIPGNTGASAPSESPGGGATSNASGGSLSTAGGNGGSGTVATPGTGGAPDIDIPGVSAEGGEGGTSLFGDAGAGGEAGSRQLAPGPAM